VVRELVAALNHRHRASYSVIAEPEAIEAVIQSGSTVRWVEVVTAWWNKAEARDAFSFATPGETHVPGNTGLLVDMTAQFSSSFAEAVQNKLSKESYLPIKEKYGQGYLAVSVQFPFFDSNSFPNMQAAWEARSYRDLECFRSIYLVYRAYQGYHVRHWRPRDA
jgi:hypothetical protein